ncbi:MAG TPA: GNAT family N-acetyltransferase [Usitatibacter sp.]|nr:GNAT family N-acetyltransferase [Usitatibacter sp.]
MIILQPMTQAQFEGYLERAVPEYAQAHVEAGDCDPDTALERARADYVSLLPAGLKSENHFLYAIHAPGEAAPIGMVWFELREQDGGKSAFIWDFRIDEPQRGKGYGKDTLMRIDERLRALGARYVSLNVLGQNHRARALYEKHGFRVVGIGMRKVFAARQEP